MVEILCGADFPNLSRPIRAAENFSLLKYAPAKACSKKCTAGSKVRGGGGEARLMTNLKNFIIFSLFMLITIADIATYIIIEKKQAR